MVRDHLRVTIKEAFANPKNVNSAQQNDRQADAKKDPQGKDRITVRVNGSENHFLKIAFRFPASSVGLKEG